MMGVLVRKKTTQGRRCVKMESESGMMWLQAKPPRTANSYQARRGACDILPQVPQ